MVPDGVPSMHAVSEGAAGTAREVNARPGDGALSRTDALKDERVRRWDIVTPSATLIGRATSPDQELSATVRRLHDEQHPAMRGHSARMHRLDKTTVNRLTRTLQEQLAEQDLEMAVLGRSPYRDPHLPAIRDRSDSNTEA